jgi:serine/alanine adding enzyme
VLTRSSETLLILDLPAENCADWDAFVNATEHASPYHLSGWRDVFSGGYGHVCHYLMAVWTPLAGGESFTGRRVAGILPLVHMRHWLFGNQLVSLPFFDSAGVLAASEAQDALVRHAFELADRLQATRVELRHAEAPAAVSPSVPPAPGWHAGKNLADSKFRMVLDLPASANLLMSSFKAKLRSQINRPVKAGLTVRIGGIDLLADFYAVFVENMRELGSPVHSLKLLRAVLISFPDRATLFVVYKGKVPIAGAMTFGFRELLSNPWASSLRRFSRDAPNMLLYWAMLEFACQGGYRRFDFGRSTRDEGTFRFKQQWGAVPEGLDWRRCALRPAAPQLDSHGSRARNAASACWRRLPLPLTAWLGPRIRGYISL